jgi:WD40 repeat protein
MASPLAGDGRRVATRGRCVHVWDTATWEKVSDIYKAGWVLRLSPDGRCLAVASHENGCIADLETGKETALQAPRCHLTDAIFLPDTKRVLAVFQISGGSSGPAVLVDMHTGKPLWQFSEYAGCAAVSPDGGSIAVRDWDPKERRGVLAVWQRRFPEWWWGHLYRPEVWLTGVVGLLWLWRVALYVARQLRRSPKSP